MDQGERDGGGRVDVSMSRMTVARGSVSMSRRVPYHDRLCAREVRLRRSRISGAADKFLGESVSGWEIDGPVRAHTRTGDSRNRVGVRVGGQTEVTVHVDQSFFLRQLSV